MYVQLDARPIEEGCGKVVCSWKSFELELTEQREEKREKPRPQPNSVFAQFSVVCMFNWMLGQLRKGCGKVVSWGKVVCSWKSSELESAEPCEENGKNPALNPIQCSRNSQSCVCSIGCSANWERLWEGRFVYSKEIERNRKKLKGWGNPINYRGLEGYIVYFWYRLAGRRVMITWWREFKSECSLSQEYNMI